MQFGAHEAMEVHEVLQMKQFLIEHFSMYQEQTMDPTLSEMLRRHLATAIDHYNHLVANTHDYHTAQAKMLPVHNVQTFDVQYGVRDSSQVTPRTGGGRMNEQSLTQSMLQIHKNSAVMHMKAALECANTNLRQLLVNGSLICEQQAYEVFNYMNHRGWYQVPVLNENTSRAMLHNYQQLPPEMTGLMETPRESGWGVAQSDIAQPQGRNSMMDPGKQSEWGRGTTDFPIHAGNYSANQNRNSDNRHAGSVAGNTTNNYANAAGHINANTQGQITASAAGNMTGNFAGKMAATPADNEAVNNPANETTDTNK